MEEVLIGDIVILNNKKYVVLNILANETYVLSCDDNDNIIAQRTEFKKSVPAKKSLKENKDAR